MPVVRVDLNADVGESFGAYRYGNDAALMRAITSANVACGFHAGDPGVMRATVRLARRHGVAVGAHPGFPDLVGFGRREVSATPQEVEDLVAYQIGALTAIATSEGLRVRHVKPHGALYNMSTRDPELAGAVARAAASIDTGLVLFGLPGSALLEAGERAGLATAREGFADRAYLPDGTLVPRNRTGALITDADAVVGRALSMVRDQQVVAIDGTRVSMEVHTICVHGDTPGAAALASRIRQALVAAGIEVAGVSSAR
jgi:UPF0271 protein